MTAALDMAGLTTSDIACFDLYSCFPIAVSNVVEGLGLDEEDPRGFTVTGGLPFFGGAGNNYSMHAIAETVQRLRDDPGAFGLVGRSEERRVGKECVSTCSSRWTPCH